MGKRAGKRDEGVYYGWIGLGCCIGRKAIHVADWRLVLVLGNF